MKEIDIEKQVVEYLRLIGHEAWQNFSGAVYDPKKKGYRKQSDTYLKGISDVLGQSRQSGVLLAFEVKTEKEYKYVTKHYDEINNKTYLPWNKKKEHLRNQIKFIEGVNNRGGIAGFVYSIECIDKLLRGVYDS